MKKIVRKLDIFMVPILIFMLGIMISLSIYFYDWYTIFIRGLGILIFLSSFILGVLFIPIKDNQGVNFSILKNIFWYIILTAVIGVPISSYIFLIVKFEKIELKNNSQIAKGVIYDFGRKRSSKYHKVFFLTPNNKKYKSEIHGNYESYKLGDTVRVIYSERIPEINRAD